jgi:hypothetical protein
MYSEEDVEKRGYLVLRLMLKVIEAVLHALFQSLCRVRDA